MARCSRLAIAIAAFPALLPDTARAESPPVVAPPATAIAPAMPGSQVPPGYVVVDPATGRPIATPAQRPQRPETLPYHEGAPVPAGYTLEESHYSGLIIGGIIPFGVLYAISLSVASGNNFEGRAGWLAVPVVGPFGWLAAHQPQSCSYDVCYTHSDDAAERSFVTMDGVFQAAGAALFVTGLVVTRKQLVLTDPEQIVVVPYASSTVHGLSVLGRF